MQDDFPQGSDEWFEARRGKITASMMHSVLNNHKSYVLQLRDELAGKPISKVSTLAMNRGKKLEPRAIALYELLKFRDVEPSPFVVDKEFDFLGGSPDGIVNDDGIIEVKCPVDLPVHLVADLGVPKEHMPQIQTNLRVTGRQWCDFISFHPDAPINQQLITKRVERDEKYIAMLIINSKRFWSRVISEEKQNNDIPRLF